MAKGPEAKVKEKAINILKFHNAWYCCPATRGMGRSGIPDIIASVNGTFVGIECKATVNNLPTDLQQHELFKIQKSGGWACVIHAGNLLDLEGLCSSIVALAELTRQEGHAKLDAIQAASEAKLLTQGGTVVEVGVETDESLTGNASGDEKRHLPKPDETIN